MTQPAVAFLMNPDVFDRVYPEPVRKRLAGRVHWPLGDRPVRLDAADTTDLATVEILLGSWGMPRLEATCLERLPRLRAVLYGAGSIRNLVTEAFWQRDIPIASAWAMNAVPVAEYTFAQIILGLKQAWARHRHYVGPDRARQAPPDLGPFGTYNATVGLVSFGQIAQRVRDRLRTLDGIRVQVYDPYLTEAAATEAGVMRCGLDELFADSDVVSIHAPRLPETRGLISADLVRRLRRGGTLINTARGAVIDEPGLIDVLQERPDLTAVLDVTEPEPPAPDSPLFTLPNVFLTPHIAGSMDRECARMGHAMVDELERLEAGQTLRFAVSREQAQVMA